MRTLVSEDPHVFVAELLSAICENVRLVGARAARAVGDACLVANLRLCRWLVSRMHVLFVRQILSSI